MKVLLPQEAYICCCGYCIVVVDIARLLLWILQDCCCGYCKLWILQHCCCGYCKIVVVDIARLLLWMDCNIDCCCCGCCKIVDGFARLFHLLLLFVSIHLLFEAATTALKNNSGDCGRML
ncbi:hypothetical protein CEXT_156581 [Caerostris extrusa]|uniref:Uncharacterized protein n=1 Tax=Caerostris extrusa TaxID=172846 RepID=A0AAV4XDL9_CAEEX|nr:hypothetical protein CEXT_156581 [Caerostris extrusa]